VPSAGECPLAVVGLVDEEDSPLVVADDRDDGGDDAVGLGSVRVVYVVDACHADEV